MPALLGAAGMAALTSAAAASTAAAAAAASGMVGSDVGAQQWCVVRPTTQHLHEPLGVDVAAPEFGWQVSATVPPSDGSRSAMRVAYRVQVSQSLHVDDPQPRAVWDSGRVNSSAPSARYSGTVPLASDSLYYWTVAVWMEDGSITLSTPASFATGLLARSDWRATWITADNATIYRTEFDCPATAKRATLFVSGLGYNEVRINGVRVGDHRLDQGWTDFAQRVYYSAFDVSAHLRPGAANAVGVTLGTGWFLPPYIPSKAAPQLLFQLQVDGKPVVLSDTSNWRAAQGPIIYDSLYNGETFDARLDRQLNGWAEPGFDNKNTTGTATVWYQPREAKTEASNATLSSQLFQPVRQVRALAPRAVTSPPAGGRPELQ